MSSFESKINDIENKKKMWMSQFNKFLVDNNIVGTAAGVSIALVTKDVIQSLVGDIIIPGIIFLLLKLNIHSLTELLPGKSEFHFIDFIKEFISWLFVVIITFVFIKVAFQELLGISDSKSSGIKSNTSKSESVCANTSISTINNTDGSLIPQQYMNQNNTENFSTFF